MWIKPENIMAEVVRKLGNCAGLKNHYRSSDALGGIAAGSVLELPREDDRGISRIPFSGQPAYVIKGSAVRVYDSDMVERLTCLPYEVVEHLLPKQNRSRLGLSRLGMVADATG